jgi:hypothetical protein
MSANEATDAVKMSGPRRALGLFVLLGVHGTYLAWCALAAMFSPKYRPVLRFQARYFRDVLRASWQGRSVTHPAHKP